MLSKLLTITLVLAVTVSCASNLHSVKGYVKDAIQLDIQAEVDLNFYKGQAHLLHLVVYELSNPAPFRSMIVKKSSRLELLGNIWVDKSIKSTYEFSIQPGDVRNITIDRVPDGRYIGIVAGYYGAKNANDQVKLYSADLFFDNTLWGPNNINQLRIPIRLGRKSIKN